MRWNRYLPSLAAACGLLGFTTLAPNTALAAGATQFVYSPLFCQTFGGTNWIYPSGQIANRHSSETMRVFCPLIHEGKHGHSGKIQVFVVHANRKERVECRAHFNHPHANSDPHWTTNNWQGDEKASHGVETATITLSGAKYLGGSHMLECKIPPKSAENNFDGESRIGTYKSGVD